MLEENYSNKYPEVGCDEAGRGCLSGPVCAAAVILPKGFHNKVLNDSKKLTEKKRNELRIIIEKEALAYGVAFLSPKEIDEINILNASIEAMHRAIDKLEI
ncbi:MAG: ribonuclease HII, partial [Flavobacteriales bacterium]|nr:ribonuclease HII [Flavobacteriales bacterium]